MSGYTVTDPLEWVEPAPIPRAVLAQNPLAGQSQNTGQESRLAQHDSGLLRVIVTERRATQIEQDRDPRDDAAAAQILGGPEEMLARGRVVLGHVRLDAPLLRGQDERRHEHAGAPRLVLRIGME